MIELDKFFGISQLLLILIIYDGISIYDGVVINPITQKPEVPGLNLVTYQ